jgi:N-methylhydantoinase A
LGIVATDIGGTFTDVVALDEDGALTLRKVLSTPSNYADGLVEAVAEIANPPHGSPKSISRMLHACTVATNAVLEKKGARTVLVTTSGFRDVLELRRIRVPKLYDPLYQRPQPLVPRDLRLEIKERIAADGSVIVALDASDVQKLVAQVEELQPQAIAVCLINAHANSSHEYQIRDALKRKFPGTFLSISSDILPELREYERTSTAVVNAYVGPVVDKYLAMVESGLAERSIQSPFLLMQSSGGMVESSRVRHIPAALLECGPAAGVIGAAKLGSLAGYDDLLTFDMGGTTAKAALVKGGEVSFTDVFEVGAELSGGSVLAGGGGYAVKLPAIDMAEVGAGGGSLVSLDSAGAIRVGPESAGSYPGPACYGFGNDRPTVTDANVVLGYIDPRQIAGGQVALNRELAIAAVRTHVAAPLGLSVEDAAFGVRRVANASMVRALKTVSVYRGYDTRLFRLFAFGGNGGLHGPEIAADLGISEVIVPPAAGVFSAVSLLLADLQSTRTQASPENIQDFTSDSAARLLGELRALVTRDLAGDSEKLNFIEQALCRYAGQAFELPVELPEGWRNNASAAKQLAADFEAIHLQRYGYCPPSGTAAEIVSLRVTGRERLPSISKVRLAVSRPANETERECYFGQILGMMPTRVVNRAFLSGTPTNGPLIVSEPEGTTLVPPGTSACLDVFDNIVIRSAKRD